MHVKYNCLVSNGIKKGHLLVSCSHQSGKAPLASAKGSCSLMQGRGRKKEKSKKKAFLISDSGCPNKFATKYIDASYTQVQSFHLSLSRFLPSQQLPLFLSLFLNAMNEKFTEFLGLKSGHRVLWHKHTKSCSKSLGYVLLGALWGDLSIQFPGENYL